MDMSEYMGTYKDEIRSNMSEAQAVLPKLNAEYSKEDIENLRRNAHTMKSSSAMMGFPTLSELCKGTEYLLKKVLNGEVTLDDNLKTFVKKSFENIGAVGLEVNNPDDDQEKINKELLDQAKKYI